MRKAGYRFRIIPSHVSERAPKALGPAQLVRHLALKKAVATARKYPNDVVLGADTLVFLQNDVIGKPRNEKHALQILRKLSGRWQRVITGVAVAWDGGKRTVAQTATSRVKFRRLSLDEMARASTKHLDKAGGYAVQEKGDGFVEKIDGDYDNVVGLPMRVVKKLLRRSADAFAKRLGHDVHF